ncbi:Glutamyl-tRNA(Gln) amidotransferase subunit A [Candidatus Izimaplasma bacterium HR1]|uniref:amidase family protein n=1 Tax=Candidatus Izimoplasma sp. HR1 TaxID=1541959 RepID=UPI0004F8012F|nr:Glutamyl-tRNA(Gln) amidotransferase subunit A [Candidatus Izimaplasma bacterium HR1]
MNYNDYDKYLKRTEVLSCKKDSVLKVYDVTSTVKKAVEDKSDFYLMGIKNTEYIKEEVLSKLKQSGFIPHTLDKMARGGRAIDIDLVNPLTGKLMTGSSSGTAINVLEDYNDIGLGSDGGGSVLAPALALNLYGIISPLFFRDESYAKSSTDGITFIPSLGFISKDIDLIQKATETFVQIEQVKDINILIPNENNILLETGDDVGKILSDSLTNNKFIINREIYPNIFGDRQENIDYLNKKLEQYDVIMSYEGPIDYFGFGDSVFGLFNSVSRQNQEKAGKGLIRVANMVNASALVVPSNDFSSGYVLIANSSKEGISSLFEIQKHLKNKISNKLYKKYFTIKP